MSQTVGVDLALNTQDWTQSAGLAMNQANQLNSSLGALATTSGLMQRALDKSAPTRTHISAFGGFAAAAAQAQQNLAGLSATQAVTGQSADKLGRGVRQLARDFPVGSQAALATVSAFTQLGISMAGQEKQALSLSKTMTQLQGANGGSAPQYAAGFAQLERTFGDQGIDPTRVAKTADSLTTVSKVMGANAQSVLDFSNSIGPMAQASGIGKTATLGISAAFSRIGQDGNYAATAVNKILTDMSKSVAGGSSGNLATYANIIGTTADNFERLYKANPVQAITAVTQAIGQAGPAGPSMLNRLGLEGVRTQNALQAISAQGGLQQAVSTSVNAYGNNKTAAAAGAAFSGVLDNFSRASTAAGQLAASLGEPLLRPLGMLSSTLAKVTGGAAGLLDTGVGRGATTAAVVGGVGLLAARRLFGIGTGAAVARQIGTSGPIGSLVYGMRSAMGQQATRDAEGQIVGIGGRGAPWSRTAGYMGRAAEAGTMGEGTMGAVNTRAMALGQGIGNARAARIDQRYTAAVQRWSDTSDRLGPGHPLTQQRLAEAEAFGNGGRSGPGIGSRIRTVGASGWAAYSNATRSQFAAAAEPDPTQRARVFGRVMGSGFDTRAFSGIRSALGGNPTELDPTGTNGRLTNAWGQFSKNISESNRAFPSFTRALLASGQAVASGVGAGPGALAAARGSIGRGLGAAATGIGSLLMNPMVLATIGISAGTAAYSKYSHRNDAQRAADANATGQSPNDFINHYNEALGIATTNTEGFATTLSTSTKQIASSVTSMSAALDVNNKQVQALRSANTTVIQRYANQSTPTDIAAQIRTSSPGGLQPSQIAGISADLQKQYPQPVVQKVLNALNIDPQTGKFKQGGGAGGGGDIEALVKRAASIPANVGWGTDTNKISESDLYSTFNSKLGGVSLKQSASDITDTVRQGIQQRYATNQLSTNRPYAQQTELRDVQNALKVAGQQGNEEVFRTLSNQLGKNVLGVDKMPRITSSEARKDPNGYLGALAARNPAFADQMRQWQKQGITLSGPGVGAGTAPSQFAQDFAPYSLLRPGFDNTAKGPAQYGVSNLSPRDPVGGALFKASQELQGTLGMTDVSSGDNLKKATAAVQDFVAATVKAGGSLDDLSAQSQKAMIANGDPTSVGFQRAAALKQESDFQNQIRQPFQNSGTTLGQNLVGASKIVNAGPGTTAESQQAYQGARQNVADSTAALEDQVKQRLMIQRQAAIQTTRNQEDYNKQVARSTEDFNTQLTQGAQDYYRQRSYAQADYQKSVYRSTRDYTKSTLRAEEDYQQQSAYSYQDYYTSRSREDRDFNIQMQRGQDDYLTSRSRAIRDFNTQLARQIEDQTKSLYDPYKRIQTQAVWDGQQLLMNLGEQNQAIAKQRSQIGQVRKMGLSDATIEELGLNDPANAQQLGMLVDNFLSDPKLIKQLNASTSERASIGKLLLTDPSNKDIARAKADFAKQLSDMALDYQKSITRARQDMTRQEADQEADFGKSMRRMSVDYEKNLKRNAIDFTTSMSDSEIDFNISMQRQDDAYQLSVTRSLQLFGRQMDHMRSDYDTSVKRMKEDIIESTKEMTIGITDLFSTANDLVKGKSVSTNKFMKDGLSASINFIHSGKNVDDLNKAYKSVFPYDLSKVFGKGGPDGVVGSSGPMSGPHGGPYAPYANPGAQAAIFDGHRTGGMGGMISAGAGATVSQGYGEFRAGEPNTGGGWPVSNPFVSQQFGADPSASNPGGHPGIDLAVPRGTEIKAPLPGVVVYAGWNDGYGNCVIMDNGGGRSTLYGHQQTIATHAGATLKAGDIIGYVDSTGNSTGDHLHFETRQNGMLQNPAVDLPKWEATAGLGSFDPGATAAAYGVKTNVVKLDPKDYTGKHYGPWGAFIELYQAAKDASSMMSSSAGALNNQANLGSGSPNTPLKAYAKSLFGKLGWADNQFGPLELLWNGESGWNPAAYNASSGATGIPQSLPGNKMASEGPDWATNGQTQIRWGEKYIKEAYGDPATAYAKWLSRSPHWYGDGGLFTGAQTIGVGERGTELVMPMDHNGVSQLAQAFGRAVHPDDLRQMLTSGHSDKVTYVSNVSSEDHSTTLHADVIEVKSEDPLDFANQLAARTRAGRLTKSGART